jgi:hypothetical protein
LEGKTLKILVIGGLGSIGSRYTCILKYLGHEPIVWDIRAPFSEDVKDIDQFEFEKAIIATPTATHFYWCKRLIELKKPFLVEKPMSKDIKECEELVELDKNKLGRVVCNYKFLTQSPTLYDFYKTGTDGVIWDCCQLVYLNPNIEIRTQSPIWTLMSGFNNHSYEELEVSYIRMINDFLDEGKHLWNLEDGLKMTQAVLTRIERDNAPV